MGSSPTTRTIVLIRIQRSYLGINPYAAIRHEQTPSGVEPKATDMGRRFGFKGLAMMDFSGQLAAAQDTNEVQEGAEKRAAPRFTSLIRAAKLVCGQGEFVCVIRDVSSTGVSIRTFHGLPTDADVALELQNGEIYELEKVRERDFDASYRFKEQVNVERLISENWTYPKRQLRLTMMMPITASTLTQRSNAFITNISQQGARLECDNVFAIDQTVRIENDFMAEVRCKVRWRRDAHYGLAFENFFSLRQFALLAARVQCPPLLKGQ